MKAQIKLGSIFGVELGLHYSWLVIAILIVFSVASQLHATDPNWTVGVVWTVAIITGLLFFACLFAHELSHALVAKAHGIPIHRITLFLLGGVAQIEKEASDAKTEFWMAIVGPITSAVLGFILLGLAMAGGWAWRSHPGTPGIAMLVWLGYINLALAAFNLIPGFPLDGGRVLHAILWWSMKSAERSTRAAARVGQMIAVLFIAYGILEFFRGAGLGGLWMAFIGWFLLQASGAAYMQVKAGKLLYGLRVQDLMSPECQSIDPNISVDDFVNEYLLRTGRRCFWVMQDDRLLGMITPGELRTVDRGSWQQTPIRSVMRPADKIHMISPEMPALEALEIMSREDVNQLPVTSDGRVRGSISRAHILQVLRTRAELPPPPPGATRTA